VDTRIGASRRDSGGLGGIVIGVSGRDSSGLGGGIVVLGRDSGRLGEGIVALRRDSGGLGGGIVAPRRNTGGLGGGIVTSRRNSNRAGGGIEGFGRVHAVARLLGGTLGCNSCKAFLFVFDLPRQAMQVLKTLLPKSAEALARKEESGSF